jgi:hypothetical protein
VAGEGRPTSCTPEVTAEVCKWLASGCYVETACNLAGIHKGTHYDWLKRAETGEQPFADYADAIQRAENQAEARAVALINKAGEEDPKALQWWLSHRHSDRWADRSKYDIGGQKDNPVQVRAKLDIAAYIADPEAVRLASELEARLAQGAVDAVGTGGAGEQDFNGSPAAP